jgi:hypothetical protein
MPLGITTLCIQCHYAKCLDLFIVIMNAVMLSDFMLSVIMLSVSMLSVIMLNLMEPNVDLG